MSKQSILDLIEETGTIFKEKEVFKYDYLPENFKYRDKELEQMAIASRGLNYNNRIENMHITGSYATGKTTTLIKYFQLIEENFNNVLPVHINCQIHRTEYKVFSKIYKKLYNKNMKTNSLNTFDIYDRIMKKIIKENIQLIIGLDDYDSLKTGKELDRTLYDLLRVKESYPEAKVSIITVTSKPAQILDPAVSTVFLPTIIKFDPYTQEQLYDIINERCNLGFFKDVISDEIIRAVTRYSYDQGDLRAGLKLLNIAGENAEKEGNNKILKRYLQ